MLKQRKWQVGLGFLMGLLLLAGLYRLALDYVGVPGQLYRYYPDTAGFYLELAPGEKLTKRFISLLDNQATLQTTQINSASAHSNKASNEQSPSPSAKASQSHLPLVPETIATTKQHRSFRHLFLEKYNSTFKPYFSMGSWPIEQADSAPVGTDKTPEEESPGGNLVPGASGHVLVVFPLKENLSLSDVIRRFDLNLEEFKQQTHGSFSFIEEKHSGTSLATINQTLFITNTPQAMSAALTHYQQGKPHVYDDPTNKIYLDQLPWWRQGTFILNNRVYTRRALPQDNHLLSQTVAKMGEVLPLTVGGIQTKPNQTFSIQFLTPIVLTEIPDIRFRTSVQTLFQSTETFPQATQLPQDTGVMIGVAGLDRVYDFYKDFWMPTNVKAGTGFLSLMLKGFNLDLRQDIISLFEKRTVLASQITPEAKTPSLMLLLDQSESKTSSWQKLATLFGSSRFPLKQHAETLGKYQFNTLALPGLPSSKPQGTLSYGTLGPTYVLATPADYKAMIEVAQGSEPNLASEPLYQQVMSDMPTQSNFLMFFNAKASERFKTKPALTDKTDPIKPSIANQKTPNSWVDGLGLALWTKPTQQGEINLLHGQLNIKLTPPPKPTETTPLPAH